MGSRLVKFSFTPGENEQIEAVIKVPEEHRSIIHGIVKDHKGKIVKEAVVKLFEVLCPQEECRIKPLTHTFTDECGQFLFGPLVANKQYVIKVWVSNIKIRELIIRPDDNKSDDSCKLNKGSSHKPQTEASQNCTTTYRDYDEDNSKEDEDE